MEFSNFNLKQSVDDYISLIQNQGEDRPHFSVGLVTPELVHSKNLITEKLWKNYYQRNRTIVNPIQDNEQPVNQ